MNKILLSILVCFVFSIPTKAYSLTNSEWLKMCETHEAICVVYLKGLVDMERVLDDKRIVAMEKLDEYISAKKDKSESMKEQLDKLVIKGKLRDYINYLLGIHKYCIPTKVNIEQIKKIMIKRLNENPEKLHKSLSYSLLPTLSKVFPCKTQ
jgi:hypothetical protein